MPQVDDYKRIKTMENDKTVRRGLNVVVLTYDRIMIRL